MPRYRKAAAALFGFFVAFHLKMITRGSICSGIIMVFGLIGAFLYVFTIKILSVLGGQHAPVYPLV
jgi:hypothetical protein